MGGHSVRLWYIHISGEDIITYMQVQHTACNKCQRDGCINGVMYIQAADCANAMGGQKVKYINSQQNED